MYNNIRNHLAIPAKEDRNQEIFQMRMNGETFRSIGKKFGISGARVRQVIDNVDKKNKRIGVVNNKFTEMKPFEDVKFKE